MVLFLINPFMAAHKIRESLTEPKLTEINCSNSFSNCSQKEEFWSNDRCNLQKYASDKVMWQIHISCTRENKVEEAQNQYESMYDMWRDKTSIPSYLGASYAMYSSKRNLISSVWKFLYPLKMLDLSILLFKMVFISVPIK